MKPVLMTLRSLSLAGGTAPRKPRRPHKLRVLFCWQCGRQLRGSSFHEATVDGHVRVLHKLCAQELGL